MSGDILNKIHGWSFTAESFREMILQKAYVFEKEEWKRLCGDSGVKPFFVWLEYHVYIRI